MATVVMQDGTEYNVSVLLGDGDSNTKTRKSDKAGLGYMTVSLSLSPANESGYEVCGSRSPGCTKACLFTAGLGAFANVKKGRIAKTRLFFQNREEFKRMLFAELDKWNKKAKKKGLTLACRLNVLSDIMWEKMFPDLFTTFGDVQFYDYTKHYKRAVAYCADKEGIFGSGNFPPNYHLTFSRSETNDNDVLSLIMLNGAINIAVVFDSKELPEQWRSRKVVNGDETDLRFLDEQSTIIGLYAKGRARKDESGFVVNTRRVPLEMAVV